MKSKLKLLWQIAYILITFAIIYFLGFADPNFRNIGDHFSEFKLNWLLLAAGGILLFWFLQALVLRACGSLVGTKLPFRKDLKITVIGEYYCAITPFSSGGQPMQMGYYKRYGVNFAKSTSILAIRMAGFMASICLISLAAVILRGNELFATRPAIVWLTILGFLINLSSVVFLLFLLINKKLVERIGYFVIRLLIKLRIFKKKKEELHAKFSKGVIDFSEAGQYIKQNIGKTLGVLLLSLASTVAFFSIAYCVYRAMGLAQYDYFTLFAMQTILYMSVSFVPTPGAIGASEGGFYLFFAGIFPSELLYMAMILWRLFTYYVNLLVGAVLIVIDEVGSMLRAKREKAEELPTGPEGDSPDQLDE